MLHSTSISFLESKIINSNLKTLADLLEEFQTRSLLGTYLRLQVWALFALEFILNISRWYFAYLLYSEFPRHRNKWEYSKNDMFTASVLYSNTYYISYIMYKRRLKVPPTCNAGIGSRNWGRGIFHQISHKSRHVVNQLMTGLPIPFYLVSVEGGNNSHVFSCKSQSMRQFQGVLWNHKIN